MSRHRILSVLLFSFTCSLGSLHAATVAHWRFEGDSSTWLLDSSGNNHTLTNGTAVGAQLTLPSSGDGSAFLDPVPLTGLANASAANFNGGGTGAMKTAASPTWTSTIFTIEAMVNIGNTTGLKTIANHLNNTLGRSWLFGIQDNRLSLLLGDGASTSELYFSPTASDFALVLDKDYYVAVAVNLTAANPADRLTFYIKNLTDGGSLVSSSVSTAFTSLDGSTDGLAIGATGHASSRFTGLIDEVRYSNTTLTTTELLVAPEPQIAFSLMLGVCASALRRRRC